MNRIIALLCYFFISSSAFGQVDTTPWTVELVWAIGGEDSDSYFTSIQSVARTQDGHLLVGERRGTQVRLFDDTGVELKQIGQEGEGPGEFTEVMSILPLPNGNFFVHDRRGGRISEFDADGEYLRSIVIPEVTIRIMQLIAYDEDRDQLAFLWQKGRAPDDLYPLLFVADLSKTTIDEGVVMPGDLIDLSEELWAFRANSVLTYNWDRFTVDESNTQIGLYPRLYNGSIAFTSFNNGAYSKLVRHSVSDKFETPPATVLDISREEFQASGQTQQYNMAGGSYTQHGMQFTDIHNMSHQMIRFDSETFGLMFKSEEGEIEGTFLDVFHVTKGHIGRHLIQLSEQISTLGGVHLLESSGPNDLYVSYWTPDRIPMLAKVRLVKE